MYFKYKLQSIKIKNKIKNSTNSVSDFQTNDSYDQILLSESMTFKTPKRKILMSRFFLVNQKQLWITRRSDSELI